MEKIDVEYILHCVRNSRVLLTQNELLKVDGLLNSAQMSLEEQLQNTSSNCDYAVAVKNLINSEVDCVQTKNGAYVNLDGVIDCLNRALHNFA